MATRLFSLKSLAMAVVVGAGLTTGLVAQQPAARNQDPDTGYAPPRPAARGAATSPAAADAQLPQPEAATNDAPPQNDIQKEREWLVAYLIAHQGYRIDQMDALEKRIDRMSPTQVQTLVDVYKQKHDFALQREQSYQQMRNQAFSMQTADRAQAVHEQNTYQQELDAGAQAMQARLNEQQQQAARNFQQNALMHQPNYMNYGNYINPYFMGPYADRYWH